MGGETIIQLATARQLAAIHILRLSGPKSLDFLTSHTRLKKTISPRHLYHTSFFDSPQKKKILDQILAVYFRTPHSFSGEEMAEIHCHGSLFVVESIMHSALSFGLRPALAGEFTRRAFINKKISAEKAEATNAFIHAETETLRNNALAIMENKASLRFSDLQKKILNMMAILESNIEFPEEDLAETEEEKSSFYPQYQKKIEKIIAHLSKMVESYNRGKKEEKGFRIIISGAPNAGKSTLLNALLQENRAIVSEKAGSTRDYLHEQMIIKNQHFSIYDTAGLHPNHHQNPLDPVEQEGIKKSYALLEKSEIIIYMLANEQEIKILEETRKKIDFGGKKILYVINKSDLLSPQEQQHLQQLVKKIAEKDNFSLKILSLKTKKAIKEIENCLTQYASQQTKEKIQENEVFLVSQRQKDLCVTILGQLHIIKNQLAQGIGEEIILEGFKSLSELLRELNCDMSNEKIFDEIFSHFCLGK